MKICHFCGNKNFIESKVQYTYRRDNKYIIVDEIPCEQCEYCGEQYFKASILKNIEKEFDEIHSGGKIIKNKIVVPVESYSDISHVAT